MWCHSHVDTLIIKRFLKMMDFIRPCFINDDMVDGCQRLLGDGNDCFLCPRRFLRARLATADLWELFGLDGSQSTLNEQRSDVQPRTNMGNKTRKPMFAQCTKAVEKVKSSIFTHNINVSPPDETKITSPSLWPTSILTVTWHIQRRLIKSKFSKNLYS